MAKVSMVKAVREFVIYTFQPTGQRDIVTDEIFRNGAEYAASMKRAQYRYGAVNHVVLPAVPTVSLVKDSTEQIRARGAATLTRWLRERAQLDSPVLELWDGEPGFGSPLVPATYANTLD